MTFLSYLCLAGLVIYPPYLIFRERRFWGAFGFSWFLLVAEHAFGVHARIARYAEHQGGHEPPDLTEIGMTIFSGWILARPFCVVIEIAYRVYRRFRPAAKTLEANLS